MEKLQGTNLQHWPNLALNPSWEQDGTGLRENVAGTELQDDQREAKDHHLLTQEDAGMHVCTFTLYIYSSYSYIYIEYYMYQIDNS